jgi:serine/threonine-protein kinase
MPAPKRHAVGHCVLYDEIASGGMATVYLGRVVGPVGPPRTVAIKRLHPQLAKEQELVAMLVDEARLTSRIRHRNVVSVDELVRSRDELLLVMDYVHGESLSRLLRAATSRSEPPLPSVAVAIAVAVLHGLHAAHDATSDAGTPLELVHRDVTPQNIVVGADGTARLVDFGVARALGRLQTTREGQLKGKVAYMAPEQLLGQSVDARADVFSAAVILWEALTSRRLFQADNEAAVVMKLLNAAIDAPSRVALRVPACVDAVVMKGLERDPERRWTSASEMAAALELALAPAPPPVVADWVQTLAAESLAQRARAIARIEGDEADARAANVDDELMPTIRAPVARGPDTARVKRVAAGLGAAAVALAVAASITYGSNRIGAGAPSEAASAVAGPIAAAPPTAAAVGADPRPSELDQQAAPAETPAAPPAASTSVPGRANLAKRRQSGQRAAPSSRCSPPYAVDERGIVRMRRECL